MAKNFEQVPIKGILKNSASFESQGKHRELPKGAKWDEMNILATHHPKDKDYGHMKIDEPKTPYAYNEGSEDEADSFDVNLLTQKIKLGCEGLPRVLQEEAPSDESDDDETEETEAERAKRKAFEMKRKNHYNEFAAVKLARKLMEQDDDNDDDEGESESGAKEEEGNNDQPASSQTEQ